MIVTVPDHCFSFYFDKKRRLPFQTVLLAVYFINQSTTFPRETLETVKRLTNEQHGKNNIHCFRLMLFINVVYFQRSLKFRLFNKFIIMYEY